MDNVFEENAVILFQGDSITDCNRNREDPDSRGDGYVDLITETLADRHLQQNIKFINRGISGDKIRDLSLRWERDCISIKPDILSILIGVNDTLLTPSEQFEEEYRMLLTRTTRALDPKIILCEPFLLQGDNNAYRDDLNPKIKIVHKLSEEFRTLLLPLDKIFRESCSLHPPEYWAPDGVHPTPAGHALIAKSWIKYVDKTLH
ncbi:MAG: SGNH/GDSL hydrolase family protein [Candidatus Scalindua sp.]|jgi:lysophospholipase L1-like esterase|nr:SGNH/GDSL hydrolase family protein [Candidatus Scalindua sp.]MBT5305735.1 SGNH/GDSL hydrolase family protein [Candidatus Scalindua sp.]MBT6052147.1 SGNH/GDSL hydrolase family protein [Candidatus Scalindua sp.]MBT6227602.1 SGNH/GDSL hydrolase family protein [Candidatus Scalindua sp.]MBT6561520.1 SGNH/GDSL hydrolase family protein [Candidatus Scalindua sp.]